MKNLYKGLLTAINIVGLSSLSWGQCFTSPSKVSLNNSSGVLSNHPTSVAVDDFNGDGNPDVATTISDAGTVGILLGNSNGSLNKATYYTVGNSPSSVAVGDFDGDGRLDLAVTNSQSSSVSILRGFGNGSFGTATYFPVNFNPQGIVVGDLNKDSKPDLIIASSGSSFASVLLNSSNGNFSFIKSDAFTGGTTSSVAIGDFNGDSNLDLAAANSQYNSVWIRLNDGKGGFSGAVTSYPAGSSPSFVGVADFNGDGRPDIAVANIFSSTVSIFINNYKNTLGFDPAINIPVAIGPKSLTIRDLNNDNKLDIVTANGADGLISVLMGSGNGSFTSATYFNAGLDPNSIAVGDFNHDGKPDLVTANYNEGVIAIVYNCSAASAALSLAIPIYDCASGQLTLSTTGGNGQPIEYRVAGLRDWAVSNAFTVPSYQRNGTTFILEARQSGVMVSTTFTPACQSVTPITPPVGTALSVSGQPVNCQSGTLQLTTIGGDGTPIEYKVPGLRDYGSSPIFTVPIYQRSGTTFTLYARQSGREVTGTFTAVCPVGTRLANPETGLSVVVYPNPVGEQFSVGVSGAAGQAVRFELTNLSGQTVVDQRAAVVSNAHTETLSLPASGAGLYLLRVSTASQSQTVKVLRP